MCFYLSELYDSTRSFGQSKYVVRPLDESPGHDVHRVDPVVAVRAYFVTDGEMLVDPYPRASPMAVTSPVLLLLRVALW